MFHKVLTIINWVVLGLCVFIINMFTFGSNLNESDSALATLMVVLALTGMIWVPVGFVTSGLSVWIEYKVLSNKWKLLKRPAVYVLVAMGGLVIVMFI